MTAGGVVAKSSGCAAPPISAVSSRATTPTSACPGVSEPTTSAPIALSRKVGDERLDDRQRDVGLEQRQAHFAQRVLDVGVGEARFAAQRLDDARQAFGQGFEHANAAPGAQHEACGALR